MFDLASLFKKLLREQGKSDDEIEAIINPPPTAEEIKHRAQTEDFHEKKMAAHMLAVETWKKCEDPYSHLLESSRYEILGYQLDGQKFGDDVAGVRIVAPGNGPRTTNRCRRMAKRVYTFSEALDEMPLPCRQSEDGWCTCFWAMVFSDEI